jgi:hypothetical protein
VVVLQQQSLLSARVRTGSNPTPPVVLPVGDPWQWWSASEIADASQCPELTVQRNWPLLYIALGYMNILTRDVARGVIGTTAVETAHTFAPVREAFWLSEEWRAANLRYYPWYGRGFIQLTWESNYARYGTMIQRDLLTDPDIAMQADVAALVMAAYFWDRGVADACNNGQWAEVRRLVQGAYAGLDTLLSTVYALA